ncbi:succinate dehydrogenase subunit 8A, mitochondrial [Canna indica]|uniref:Succinate dehydrogenase subunit 8A, mitochondrial n=1 Tax=Canna indica TaxID=4628 RepID=A0AAQ3JY78_9LILI|nr:succinate dehydrogenase subunit 8A, mitochondrial [Canna indica]
MIYRNWSLLSSTVVIWGGVASVGLAGIFLFGGKETVVRQDVSSAPLFCSVTIFLIKLLVIAMPLITSCSTERDFEESEADSFETRDEVEGYKSDGDDETDNNFSDGDFGDDV